MQGFLISGDVGVRKPERAMFEHLLRKTGARADEIVFVDDSIANLDAAAAFGIQTILFADNGEPEGGHLVVCNCDDLVNVVLSAD